MLSQSLKTLRVSLRGWHNSCAFTHPWTSAAPENTPSNELFRRTEISGNFYSFHEAKLLLLWPGTSIVCRTHLQPRQYKCIKFIICSPSSILFLNSTEYCWKVSRYYKHEIKTKRCVGLGFPRYKHPHPPRYPPPHGFPVAFVLV